jgi:hypothetical protein
MPRLEITDEEIDQILKDGVEDGSFIRTGRPIFSPAPLWASPLAERFPHHSRGVPCPLCSLPLRLREGRNGIFYGCSSYPECRGSRDANQITGEVLSQDDQRKKVKRKASPPAATSKPKPKTRFDIMDEMDED